MALSEQEKEIIKRHHCYLDPNDSYSEEDLRETVGITDGDIIVDWRHVVHYAFKNFTKFKQDFLREVRINAINELDKNIHSEEKSSEIIDKEIQSHIQCFLSPQDGRNNLKEQKELTMIMERYKKGDFSEFKFNEYLFNKCIRNILSSIESY